MPFKEYLRNNPDVKKQPSKYRVQNWSEYNKALKHRGSLTLWVNKDLVINWYAKKQDSQDRGRPAQYSDEAITIMLTLRLILKKKLRQLEGFFRSLFSLLGFDLRVPDYSTLSRRGDVPLQTRQLEEMKEPGHIVLDSTGLKVFGESEWLKTKHGQGYHRKVWRKLHIGINGSGYFVSRVMTDHITDDRSCMDEHLRQIETTAITEVIADTGYDGEPVSQQLGALGIKTVISPSHDAKVSDKENPTKRDETIAYIKENRTYAWQTKNKYGRRASFENSIYRYKEIIGRKILSRKWVNQDAETHLGCVILNQFTKLGMPVSVKMF